jgi:hypothetical protein
MDTDSKFAKEGKTKRLNGTPMNTDEHGKESRLKPQLSINLVEDFDYFVGYLLVFYIR